MRTTDDLLQSDCEDYVALTVGALSSREKILAVAFQIRFRKHFDPFGFQQRVDITLGRKDGGFDRGLLARG